jgi:hypothetical protein
MVGLIAKKLTCVGVGVGVNSYGHQIGGRNYLILLMARDGIEPPTHGFSVRCSTS